MERVVTKCATYYNFLLLREDLFFAFIPKGINLVSSFFGFFDLVPIMLVFFGCFLCSLDLFVNVASVRASYLVELLEAILSDDTFFIGQIMFFAAVAKLLL